MAVSWSIFWLSSVFGGGEGEKIVKHVGRTDLDLDTAVGVAV